MIWMREMGLKRMSPDGIQRGKIRPGCGKRDGTRMVNEFKSSVEYADLEINVCDSVRAYVCAQDLDARWDGHAVALFGGNEQIEILCHRFDG